MLGVSVGESVSVTPIVAVTVAAGLGAVVGDSGGFFVLVVFESKGAVVDDEGSVEIGSVVLLIDDGILVELSVAKFGIKTRST